MEIDWKIVYENMQNYNIPDVSNCDIDTLFTYLLMHEFAIKQITEEEMINSNYDIKKYNDNLNVIKEEMMQRLMSMPMNERVILIKKWNSIEKMFYKKMTM